MAYSYKTEAARWAAIRDRDSHAEGCFVYCIKTTKIFCRPTCKARLCRRSNVEFYETNAEAQAAGYRACKRCKPELAKFVPEADQSIDRVREMLERLPNDAPLPKLDTLAASTGLTKYHFHRCFKKATGLTPREYALSRRGRRAPVSGVHDIRASAVAATPFADDAVASDSASSNETAEAQIPDFDIDEWLKLGPEDPVFPIFSEDYATPFSMTDGDLNTIVPTPQYDTSPKALVASDDTFAIHYSTIDTTHGVLLMAFNESQICKLELTASIVEAMESLGRSFPIPMWRLVPVDELPAGQRAVAQQQVAAVVDAPEMPFGKTPGVGMGMMTPPAEDGSIS